MKYILILLFFVIGLIAEPITPLPKSLKTDPKKVELGHDLFFDPRLSVDDTISCASCHDLNNGGDDSRAVSLGVKNQKGGVNAPTVLNAVFNFRQFWDGRAANLQEQAAGPIENPVEMGNSFEKLIPKLNKTSYKKRFEAIYKEGITKDSITDAIAEFEKTLITPSPFDEYLKGDKHAISQEQKDGYELFKTKGCISCHHGRNVGGNMYNKFGIIYKVHDENLGRYNITKNESDKYFFKVPSLRNIALTAPYFHNGEVSDLKEAVKFMAKHQIGRDLKNIDVEKIVAFLNSLTGKLSTNPNEEVKGQER